MKLNWRNPFFILGLVILWRIALLVFTAQPLPANDAFIFDGGVANWLQHGHYVNPCLEVAYPISSGQVFSIYPPVYQIALVLWMPVFGISALSIMAMHLVMFAVAGILVIFIMRKFFPDTANFALLPLLLIGNTFTDRPEDLAHIFGLVSLWLLARQISNTRQNEWIDAGIILSLLLTLYTSVIVGAFYFGAGFLAAVAAWPSQRRHLFFVPFFTTAILFAAIVLLVREMHPLWWQGFLENGQKQSVTGGFHAPHTYDLVKLVRTAPVFLLGLVILPFAFARRKSLAAETWLPLAVGVFVMGLATLFLTMTLIAPDYVKYVVYGQVIFAAGLLTLTARLFPETKCWPRALMLACVILVSIRAVGMTTWGVACAWQNSYWQTQENVQAELKPFVHSQTPVVISSAFLYRAQAMGVLHPIHSDWYYDRVNYAPNADFDGLVKLHPTKLVLTQFDYYRGFIEVLNKLRQHPELVSIRVHDEARIRTPDASPSLQRILQHISWAPVIVDLNWKK